MSISCLYVRVAILTVITLSLVCLSVCQSPNFSAAAARGRGAGRTRVPYGMTMLLRTLLKKESPRCVAQNAVCNNKPTGCCPGSECNSLFGGRCSHNRREICQCFPTNSNVYPEESVWYK